MHMVYSEKASQAALHSELEWSNRSPTATVKSDRGRKAMAGQKRSLPFDLALADPLGPPGTRRRVLERSVWDSFISRTSSSPSRQHALEAHYSCVNALAISPPAADGARWLASGGDDKRVLLWDTALDSETTTASEPDASYTGASVSGQYWYVIRSEGEMLNTSHAVAE